MEAPQFVGQKSPPRIDEMSIREVEVAAKLGLSWPARMLWAFLVFLVAYVPGLIVAGTHFGDRIAALYALPIVYLGVSFAGYGWTANRAYDRLWAKAPGAEPARVVRKLRYLPMAVAGILVCLLCVLVVVVWIWRFRIFGDFPQREADRFIEMAGKAFVVLVGIAAGIQFLAAMMQGALIQDRPQQVGFADAELGASPAMVPGLATQTGGYLAALRGDYRPGPEWTSYDDPSVVAWAKAWRAVWRSHWIASAPTRGLSMLLLLGLPRLLGYRPGRGAAVRALANAFGGQVTRYDERPPLDWLDEQGWGPAPLVPGVWSGARYTVRGAYRGMPVMVSVVHRLASRRRPALRRTDIFMAMPVGSGLNVPQYAYVRAAQLGYQLSATPWGIVLSRDGAAAAALLPDLVLELLDAALST